jgi:hypothetical protein
MDLGARWRRMGSFSLGRAPRSVGAMHQRGALEERGIVLVGAPRRSIGARIVLSEGARQGQCTSGRAEWACDLCLWGVAHQRCTGRREGSSMGRNRGDCVCIGGRIADPGMCDACWAPPSGCENPASTA